MQGKSAHRTGRVWRQTAIGLVVVSGLISQPALSEDVGSIAAEFSVSNGTATYTIPIQMPQGVAGMKPEVSLNYSSQGGNGHLGLGWSVAGLSAIHRCPATIAQDGVRGSVELNQNDKFCMDGQRLIVIDGTYGAVGREYRTEIDGISKITSVGGSLAVGPASWIVKTKAGQTMEFGATSDSKRITPVSTDYPTAINVSWMLNKVTDAVGNTITYHYHNDRATGEQYLEKVAYAGNSVVIEYDSTRPDKYEAYSHGFVNTVSQRVKKITSYTGTSAVRSYTPTYVETTTTFQSRIASIKECAGSGDCLPETIFNYDGGESATLGFNNSKINLVSGFTKGVGGWNAENFPRMMADVDGDGLQDIVGFANAGVSVHLSSGKPFSTFPHYGKSDAAGGWNTLNHIRTMADVNGDGMADIVGFGESGVSYALSQGDSFATPVTWVSGNYGHASSAGGWEVDKHPRMLADVDGDGKADIVGFGHNQVSVKLNSGGSFPPLNAYGAVNDWNDEKFYRTMADVNGDGRADIVGIANDAVVVAISKGSSFAAPATWLSGSFFRNDLANISYVPLSPQPRVFYERALADANGDGLVDLIGFYLDGVYVSVNTGKRFLPQIKWIAKYGLDTDEPYVIRGTKTTTDADGNITSTTIINGWHQYRHPRMLADLNGDGRVDIVGFAGSEVYASLSKGDGFSDPVLWHDNFDYEASPPVLGDETFYDDHPRMIADLNGDGLSEIVGFNHYNVTTAYNPLAQADQLTHVRDGNWIDTEIEYKTIAGPNDHYEKQVVSDAGTGDEILPLQIPFHVVTKVSTSNGLYSANSVAYRYGGLKAHKEGRGLLGFTYTETENLQTGFVERTEFSQVFPRIGSPSESWTKAADGTVLSHSKITPADKTTYAGKVHFPYVSKTVSDEYELNGSHIKTEEVFNDLYDNYGNIIDMHTRVSGGGKVFETFNHNVYKPADVTNWHLGRLSDSVVTQKSTDTTSGEVLSEERSSAFTYYPATGLLWTETIEPNDPELIQTTTYEYDAFGNKTKSIIDGAYLTASRDTESVYDAEGRYPLWTKNAKKHKEDYVHDPLCGKKKSLTGPNSLTTVWTYDAFCRPETETRADGTQTTTQRYRVVDSTHYQTRPAGVPASTELYPLANVFYKIVTTSTGQPTVTVYYDQLGRELRKETVGFNNRIVYQDTEYDNLGRIQRASRSYYAGDPIYWVNFQYDALGRVTRQDAPADYNARAITKTSYNGLVTTVTDPKGRITKTTKDVAGNVIRTDQPDGAFVINRYDPYGNLLETEDIKGNIVKMTYDKRGRKTAMDDPDMGHWEYKYNAVGELTWQKDAENQTVDLEYDVLGRMTKRTEAEGVTNWYYDTQPYGKGKLASVTAPNGYSKTITYEDKGRAETTTTIIGGQDYAVTTVYDDTYGRVKKVIRPGGFEVENVYDTNGYLLAKRSPASQVADYDKAHLDSLKSLAVTSASEALDKAAQYAADAAYYEQWADTYRNEVAQNANVQYLTAEVAALQKHKSYKLYINQTTGDLYLESPDRVMILHGDIDTPIMIPPEAHYQVVAGANSEWTLQAVDLTTWSNSVLPNLADSGEHVFFGDYNGDGKTDYIRSGQNVENPLYDSALLERLAQTAGEIQYVANTLWNLADDALARASQLIAVAGQVEDRMRQAELWAENSDGDDLTDMTDATSGAITYWQANTRDAEHRLTGFRQGNGLVTLRDYDPASGHLMGIQTGFQFGGNVRELEYHYDALDNVTSRHDRVQGVTESFQYDNLDRLKKNSVSGSVDGVSYSYSTDYEYDLTGNILYKSDVGSYQYGTGNTVATGDAGPSALTAAGPGHTGYAYDNNGNVTAGGGRVFDWTSFNKPKRLQKDATWIEFTYGPDRARYLKATSDGETTVYIGKLYEEIKEGTKTTRKHFIYAGGELAAIQIKTVDNNVTQPDQTRYMHTDALGSVDTITDGFGNIVERMGFDPFGMRRAGNWNQGLPLVLAAFTNRGFTGHEHVDELGIIHMNGRIYDPELGRFLSADPLMQAPLNSQNHNRYSYVINNPLKYTDPSGFSWWSKTWKKIKHAFKKYASTIITVVSTMFGMPFIGALINAGMALANGASIGHMALGFVTSCIGGYVGGPIAGRISEGIGLAARSISTALIRGGLSGGISGGLYSMSMGGSFGRGFRDGFRSGAVTAGGVWGVRAYQTEVFIENNIDCGAGGCSEDQLNAIRDAGQSPIGQRLMSRYRESSAILHLRPEYISPYNGSRSCQFGACGPHVDTAAVDSSGNPINMMYFDGDVQNAKLGSSTFSKVVSGYSWGASMDDGTTFVHELSHTATGYGLVDPINVAYSENIYRGWMGKPVRGEYVYGMPVVPREIKDRIIYTY